MKSTFTFFIFLFFIFGVSQDLFAAKCIAGSSKKVIGGKDLIADRCPPTPKDLNLGSAQLFCNGQGWSFFGLDGGGFGCSTQYRNYQDFCQKNFNVSTDKVRHKDGYSTISPDDMKRCIAGNSAAPNPVTSEKCADGDSVESGCNCDESAGFKVDEYTCRKVSATDGKAKLCTDAGGTFKDSVCSCDTGSSTAILNYSVASSSYSKCEKVSASEAATSPAAKAMATSDCPDLQKYEADAKQCKSKGIAAVQKCNPDNTDSNKSYGDMQDALRMFSQVSMMKGKQEGSAQACFDAGMVGTVGYQALDLLKPGCSADVDKCTELCGSVKEITYERIHDACYARIQANNQGVDQSQLEPEVAKIRERFIAAKKELDAGDLSCSKDAKSEQDRAAQMMKEMNQTAQQATKCQCQLTAGQTNCDEVQGPEYCAAHPTDTQKCPITYDIKNPLKPTTSSVATNGAGTAQVAGPGYAAVNSGNVNFKPGAAGGGVGDFGDLSSGSTGASGDATQGGGVNPFAAAAGGGGGGSGGGTGGSDGSGAAAGGEPEAKAGVGGLFNNLKTGLANMFGGGSNKNSGSGKNYGTKGGANGKEVDPNAWKPRTLAGGGSGSAIGGKNTDLFKTISNQYGNQYHTLMTVPEPVPK